MNRINKVFKNKKENNLAIYFTAGFPQLNDTRRVLLELDRAGADIVEIGMPFSDPLADGSTIQASNHQSLESGMSLKVLFDQLEGMREETQIPVVLMGYINPVLQFGIEKFCKKCQEVGVDGLILPDLPLPEYLEIYQPMFEKYGLNKIFLVTPQTSDERIRELDAASNGFLYAVSTASTTGKSGRFSKEQEAYFKKLGGMNLKNPVMIGFGIAGNENFQIASKHVSGGVVGSEFIRALRRGDDIGDFVRNMKGGRTVHGTGYTVHGETQSTPSTENYEPSAKILVLDNYDSFTYNLVQYLEEITGEMPVVKRNDQISLEEVGTFDKILLSPGPGLPSEAGILLEVIKKYASTKSILGVCLGLQAIGEAFGGDLENLNDVYHGMATPVEILEMIEVGRYHSWVVSNKNVPKDLSITAADSEGQIMAMTHKEFDVRGVQFHPESIMTKEGRQMLENWVKS